ncbi:MAG: hypothetical protein HRJ53_15210 [Acidobacteria bacterium Pan2503]|uniref:Uncharacterized protein n=1 Tax=Candidatus Acidiferrum panamense TaxID=2741543 RepID=A0A7V8NRT9_9BACT|nr:hypothetical protein [Candidatus Acidoferrum panamensis]
MPDWQELVRRRLSGLALDARGTEEVHAELAAHLEEAYETFCKQGLPEREAVDRTMEQVSDWRELQAKILIARSGDSMRKRMQQLWIPGFLTLILSTVFLMTLQEVFGVKPRMVGIAPGTILFYAPWLTGLPFVGALGAYLSSRAGGSRSTMMLASVFPALSLAAAFLLMFPIGMIIEQVTKNDLSFGVVATTLLSNWIGWIAVPGAELLAGGLVAQLFFGRTCSSRDATSSSETTHA